jgi:hypothetical protein
MSADKEKLNQLVERIDEILIVLKDVAEDLRTVSSSIKSLAVGQITTKPATNAPVSRTPTTTPATKTPAPAPRAAPAPTPSSGLQTIEDVRMMFPEDLDNMLSFEEKPDYVIIKPKQFLGSENFAKIASTVRGLGGEYISAGRDSHFRVYKKKA